MSDNAKIQLHNRLTERLVELRREYASGEQQIAALDTRMGELRNTLLRIAGAIQVLEESLAETSGADE
ncbi:MAG: hypothetical protein GC145_14890 [Caulobacter sp.]|nr:hypothetical protein [Caulobacter sp.]